MYTRAFHNNRIHVWDLVLSLIQALTGVNLNCSTRLSPNGSITEPEPEPRPECQSDSMERACTLMSEPLGNWSEGDHSHPCPFEVSTVIGVF